MKIIALNQNKDFRRLYYRGRSSACKTLVTYVMKSRQKTTRVGITSSKKIGKAYQRNRARRVIRAAYAELAGRIDGKYGIGFVDRPATCLVKMQVVKKDMEKQLLSLGVIK